MKNIAFILFFVFQVSPVFSQTGIKGQLVDETGEAVTGASAVLMHWQDSSVITYDLSDKEGFFELYFAGARQGLDSVLVNIRCLGYLPLYLSVKQFSIGRIVLSNSTTQLKELDIEAAAISFESDTITYLAKAFANKQDRSLEDVLKNLPGLEVGENGALKYQGENINKFYIEGLDLLEGRYSLATKNIPHESVAAVEILENHQHVKMMEGKVPSFQPSINITLKPGNTFTGKGDAGLGLPGLLDANLSPMMFNKDFQFIGTAQYNNSGKDIENQLEVLNPDNTLAHPGDKALDHTLGFPSMSGSFFAVDRMLFNRSFFSSLNMIKGGKKGHWKYQIDYRDTEKEESLLNEHDYYLEDTVRLKEERRTHYKAQKLALKIIHERNTDEVYLKNKCEVVLGKHNENSSINQSQTWFSQPVNHRYISVSNTMSQKKFLGSILLTFDSFVKISRSSEKLSINDFQLPIEGMPLPAHQHYQPERFLSSHSIKTGKFLGKVLWTTAFGFDLNLARVQSFSNINKTAQENDFINGLTNRYLQSYLTQSFNYSAPSGKWKFTADIPFQFQAAQVNDPLHSIDESASRPVISPRLKLEYNFSPLLDIRGRISWKAVSQADQLQQGFVIENYRVSSRANAPVHWNEQLSSFVALRYKNPLKAWFLYLVYNQHTTYREFMPSRQIDDRGLITTVYTPFNYLTRSRNMNFRATRSLFSNSVNAAFNSGIAHFRGMNRLNNILSDIELRNFHISLSADYSTLHWLSLRGEYKRSWQSSQVGHHKTGNNISETECSLDIYFFHNKHTLGILHQFYDQSMGQPLLFGDLVYRLKVPESRLKRRIEIEATFQNIYNNLFLTQQSFNEIHAQRTTYRLRPIQFVISVKLSLMKGKQ